LYLWQKFFDAASLNSELLACWRLWRQKITTKWLKGILFIRCSCGLMNTERPLVPFPMSYYPC